MSVIPDKKDYKNVDKSTAAAFPDLLVKNGYALAMHTAPTEKSHFDRFGLVKNNKRVVLVYDVKASILSITAADEQFAEVCSLWNRFSKSASANTKTSDDIQPKQKLSSNLSQNANKSGALNKSLNGAERGNNGNKTAAVSPDRNKTANDKNEKKVTSGQASATGKDLAASQGENVNAAGNNAAKSKSNAKNADKKIKTDKSQKNKQDKNQSDKNRQIDLSQNAQSAAPNGKTKEDDSSEKTRQSDSTAKATSATNQNAKSVDNKQSAKQSETQKGKKQPAKQQETKKDKQPNNAKQISGKNQAESSADKSNEPIKNDFSLKKYSAERFDYALQSLKNAKIKYKSKGTQGSGAARVDVYEVSENKNKLTVTFMPEKQILQIQGKANDFSRKIQTYFSEGGDYKSAVKAHIEQKQTDEKAADVEKRLKKYLPVGSTLLSPQAKIDFSIGIVDLLSGNIVLSDYSSLLIPPYRGLEKLIFDLEQAQGIKVKMVGQAYEKDENGAYVLKALYRKRIGSIVYAEVMAALYTEYNSTRNYYVHSGPQLQNKVINDKNQAISIYENMLAVVEYNAKKLREIGFTLKKQS